MQSDTNLDTNQHDGGSVAVHHQNLQQSHANASRKRRMDWEPLGLQSNGDVSSNNANSNGAGTTIAHGSIGPSESKLAHVATAVVSGGDSATAVVNHNGNKQQPSDLQQQRAQRKAISANTSNSSGSGTF